MLSKACNSLLLGDVKYAAIRMENNKSKGCGVVRFTTQDEARRAIRILIFVTFYMAHSFIKFSFFVRSLTLQCATIEALW